MFKTIGLLALALLMGVGSFSTAEAKPKGHHHKAPPPSSHGGDMMTG